jgi:predicted Rossmann fold nucleotide-binding protein DprA/Smf involved in DNA uptake
MSAIPRRTRSCARRCASRQTDGSGSAPSWWTNGEDWIEDLLTPAWAALTKGEEPEAEQRNLLLPAFLNSSEMKIYELPKTNTSVHIDDIVERSGLNSSGVLATLFDLEMKGIVRPLPGKQFDKVLLQVPIVP